MADFVRLHSMPAAFLVLLRRAETKTFMYRGKTYTLT